MAGRGHRVLEVVNETLRVMGSALGGVVAPLRSRDGSFGTQRMQSRERAEQRSRDYPSD